ncbi:MAG TPA: AMP-binding protein, partial [Mycobacteriales bacterium]|nr:AMP-binding protein [Mycobacteriales bacterium]
MTTPSTARLAGPAGPASDDPALRGDLAALVRAAAERTPDKDALLFHGRRLTWRELDDLVDRTAAALRSLGLAPGDRLGLQLGNTLEFPVVYFGALRAGLVAVPLNTGYTPAELRHALSDSGARALVVRRRGAAAAEQLAGELDALEHVVVADGEGAGSLTALQDAAETGPVEPGRGGEDLAVVLYT